jgi:type VI secretion system secreted protein VgrG
MAGATQAGRFMELTTPLGKDVLLLEEFSGTEGISKPFSFHVDVLTEREKPVTGAELLFKKVTLRVRPNTETKNERIIHGMVRSLTDLGRYGSFRRYRLQVVPELWFLSLGRNCRVFQNLSVKEIIQKLFMDRKFSDFRWHLSETYEKREYTVQYRESDLDFVSRLLEHHGIFYFFEHTAQKCTMVIGDHVGALKNSPIRSDIRFMPNRGRSGLAEGVVEALSLEARAYTGSSVLDDYWYESPTTKLSARAAPKPKGTGEGEFYDYPGGYRKSAEGRQLAKVRVEAEEVGESVLEGEGNAVALLPGYGFNLKESDLDRQYLVLEVSHETGRLDYRSSPEEVEAGDQNDPHYLNTFTAIPYSTPYRPQRRTPVPTVGGVQTAVVVGPKGDETYTDKYGRVKVRFHWDREARDEKSSCWIRVASTWAGNKWGAFQLPRVGQEVVVDFLEGDPDRPLVTGSVYNAQQMPPFDANPTQSGWKSHSTKGGGADSNELRFEDKKGSEEIYLRAEKDHKVVVVNDEALDIGNDRKATIKNDDTVTVNNKQTVTVKKDQKIVVEMGNRSVETKKGNVTTKAPLGKISFEAMQSIEFKVGANKLTIDQTGVTISGTMVKIDAKAMVKAEAKGPVMIKGALVQVQGQGPVMVKGMPTMIG